MTDENAADNVVNDDQPPKPEKKRSPAERVIVWGAIAILLVVVAIEWRAQHGYKQALAAVSDVLQASDATGDDVTLPDVEKLMAGAKAESAPSQGRFEVLTYEWNGLFRSYMLRLQIEPEDPPLVLAVDSKSDPNAPIGPSYDSDYWPEPSKVADSGDESAEEGMEEGMGGGPPGGHDGEQSGGSGGPGGSRKRQSFEEMDADGDGKLSSEETPERMREFFDRIDSNGDGVVVKEELDEMRRQFSARRRPDSDAGEEESEEGDADADTAMPADSEKTSSDAPADTKPAPPEDASKTKTEESEPKAEAKEQPSAPADKQ